MYGENKEEMRMWILREGRSTAILYLAAMFKGGFQKGNRGVLNFTISHPIEIWAYTARMCMRMFIALLFVIVNNLMGT